jgi:hypothetical protein
MLAIAWKEEEKLPSKDDSIRGLTVGNNDTTLNEMWKTTPKQFSGRI